MNKSHVPAAQRSVLGMLIDDHREAQKLFKEFKSAKDSAAREEIVKQACMALTAHTEIEEQHFYPLLRDADPKAFGSLLNEAKVEHASAKDLISQLQAMKPADDLYEAHFTVLGEYTNHHITEEEDELFPKVIEKDIDLRHLEAPMQETKEQVLADASSA
ncbi:hemerythrin domain-containing protein [Allopusillimonas soli]|uniref:Hemerythrin domain-containing protein n=1 Tax=Allopusillimonas soli TaxID=659016 RepID=A0A853FG06_9BURK|nr:hemerythrin domain-containing protein [Allopusillimonas soli]NYT36946.1 hemerythrin domain-containing protein [Allopusillimonas soli]TEA75397.1 hemerythrin domain-containing protein [Allopusillimonas soli]